MTCKCPEHNCRCGRWWVLVAFAMWTAVVVLLVGHLGGCGHAQRTILMRFDCGANGEAVIEVMATTPVARADCGPGVWCPRGVETGIESMGADYGIVVDGRRVARVRMPCPEVR